ncbi:MAG: hypothetical protein ACREJ3_09265 [Polyangiaceae bacterium]
MTPSSRVNLTVKIAASMAAAVVGAACLGGCGSPAASSAAGAMDGSLGSPDAGDLAEGGFTQGDAAPGDGAVGTPPLMLSPPAHRRIAAGQGETCAASVQSRVACWGSNFGKIGTYTALSGSFSNLAIGPIGSLNEIVCGVSSSGSVSCADWTGGGSTLVSELQMCSPQPPAIDLGLDRQGLDAYLAITRPSAQAVVVSPNYCMQFGPPAGAPVLHRVGVAGGHSCGIAPNGAAVCWNANPYGPDGGLISKPTSEPTPADDYVDIVESSIAACGATASGAVRCWDSSGVEATGRFNFPGEIAAVGKRVIQLATDGTDDNLCALLSDGTMMCSGIFDLGDITSTTLADVVEIAVGVDHVCGVRPDDSVICIPIGCSGNCVPGITPPANFKVIPAH